MDLQNRYALDIILASKGGVCALIHSHCCVYISDYSVNISHTVHRMEEMIQHNPITEKEKLDFGSLWDALWSWLPDGSWIRIIMYCIIIIIIVGVMFCCCIQCMPFIVSICKNCDFRVKPRSRNKNNKDVNVISIGLDKSPPILSMDELQDTSLIYLD